VPLKFPKNPARPGSVSGRKGRPTWYRWPRPENGPVKASKCQNGGLQGFGKDGSLEPQCDADVGTAL